MASKPVLRVSPSQRDTKMGQTLVTHAFACPIQPALHLMTAAAALAAARAASSRECDADCAVFLTYSKYPLTPENVAVPVTRHVAQLWKTSPAVDLAAAPSSIAEADVGEVIAEGVPPPSQCIAPCKPPSWCHCHTGNVTANCRRRFTAGGGLPSAGGGVTQVSSFRRCRGEIPT